jgi:hypothetical protein
LFLVLEKKTEEAISKCYLGIRPGCGATCPIGYCRFFLASVYHLSWLCDYRRHKLNATYSEAERSQAVNCMSKNHVLHLAF